MFNIIKICKYLMTNINNENMIIRCYDAIITNTLATSIRANSPNFY